MTTPATPSPKRKLPFQPRWVTLGEIVGIVALLIAGLGYWDSHRERSKADKAEAVAEKKAVVRSTLLLRAIGSGDRLTLQPAAGDQVIQSQTVVLPTEIRAEPVRTTGESRIERDWLERGVIAARKRVGDLADDAGDRRLPVGIETTYVADGESRTDRALYDVGYSLKTRLLRGDTLALQGLSLVRRVRSGELRAAVDALWAERTSADTAAALAAKPERR